MKTSAISTLKVRACAALLLAAVFACEKRTETSKSDAASTTADSSLLTRTDVTLTDRALWFERLRWPNACEEGFAATHLTDDGGLEFHDLEPRLSLVIVRCTLGAYQPSSSFVLYDQRGASPAASVLELPTFQSLDGRTLTPARESEVTGEVTVLDARHELTVLTLARQIGDCGTWARYNVRGGTPSLVAFAERVECPSLPGERADPKPGEPPAGWKSVAIK